MKSRAIAVLLATVAMYVWGFLYWGVNPLPYTSWQQTTDDVAAGKALLDLLPNSGTYYIPSPRHDADTLSRLFEAGPLAFIHFHRQGRPQHDPMIMIKGFVLDLAVVILLAALLRTARPAAKAIGSMLLRFKSAISPSR